MRRLISITAFALFLAVPLWAQHGGGHAGGGGHGGFSGGHAGGFGEHAGGFGGGHISSGGGHVSGSTHFSPGFSHGLTRTPSMRAGFSGNPFLHDRFGGSRFGSRFGGRGFRNRCYGYGCWGGYGYPWWGAGYYDPWWWWNSDSGSYDEDYERDRATAEEMNQQSLEEQRMLRQEEADRDQDLYARAAPAPRQPEGQPVLPATVLVFRDKHQREIQNYAIVGQTLWNFAPQRTEKVSLADLDLAATTKANEDRGLTFRLPTSEAR